MSLQSRAGFIDLLPALPKAWPPQVTKENPIVYRVFLEMVVVGARFALAALLCSACCVGAEAASGSPRYELKNEAYRVAVTVAADGTVNVRLDDRRSGLRVAEGACLYRASEEIHGKAARARRLEEPVVTVKNRSLVIRGTLLGLELAHTFTLPEDKPLVEERIVVRNSGSTPVVLTDFEVGMTRRVTDTGAAVVPELVGDRVVAVPFRYRSRGYRDYSIGDLANKPGSLRRILNLCSEVSVPSRHRPSEGWAWTHGDWALGIFSFNQDHMVFSVISQVPGKEGVRLRLGGAVMINDEPAALGRIAPGQSVDLGLIRYETVRGGYTDSMYAYRKMLDQKGCRFPADYNPPVHWNQLYDMHGAWKDRAHKYTKAIVETQAAKARDYSCEAIYLDPGWDTDFGTFLWGQQWLGPRKQFIEEIETKYGLKVSLHLALATWMSHHLSWGLGAVNSWPEASHRKEAEAPQAGARPGAPDPIVCLGSKQYLDEAERRILESCADGVVFLMFDGNAWNGGCHNAQHGHPVPYRMEDHIRANLDLAQRIHAKYPKVLIEMHDILAGGTNMRGIPIYYKYGLPGSYDENWGFELMWKMLKNVQSGRAKMLYYANLGCNVPFYLHVNLAQDNEHLLGLWWYASTCRHLGVGGTHRDAKIAAAQREAMKRYRRLERFYKRGEFFGISEEIHLHVVPEENAFVVNMFNLSPEKRTVGGGIELRKMGLDPKRKYPIRENDGRVDNGVFHVSRAVEPWATQLIEVGVEKAAK